MSEVVQGDRCRSCGGACLMDQFAVIRVSPTEGRVRISTCIGCIIRLNGLEIK